MNLFKLVCFFLLITSITLFSINFFSSKKNYFTPVSSQNDFYQQLNLAIQTSQLEVSSIKIRDFNNEVEFYLINNENQIKVVLSTQKNPFWQISILPKLLKTVKIDQGQLKLVDLSPAHPYVTFKNN